MLLKGESHDPCGQLWRNYRHPALQGEGGGGKFVSGSIGAKLAWTLKVISLSGLRRRRVRRKSGGPLINAGGLCTSTHKTEQPVARLFIWPRTKLARDSVEGKKPAA